MNKIGEGAVSICYQLDDDTVVLVGKRDDSFESYKRLKTNLDMLEGKIKSVRIPGHAKLIEPCKEYPLGAITMTYVSGVPLKERNHALERREKKMWQGKEYEARFTQKKEAFGRKLVEFIKEMQEIEPMRFPTDEEVDANCAKLRKSLPLIAPYLTDEENLQMERLTEDYRRAMFESKFSLTHGDLQEENLLLDENDELTGIIDFGNMEFYITEVEYFPLMNFDNDIFQSMYGASGFKIVPYFTNIVGLARHIRFFKHVAGKDGKATQEQLAIIRKLLQNKIKVDIQCDKRSFAENLKGGYVKEADGLAKWMPHDIVKTIRQNDWVQMLLAHDFHDAIFNKITFDVKTKELAVHIVGNGGPYIFPFEEKGVLTFKTLDFNPNFIEELSTIAEKNNRLDLWGVEVDFVDGKVMVRVDWTDHGMYNIPEGDFENWKLEFECVGATVK